MIEAFKTHGYTHLIIPISRTAKNSFMYWKHYSQKEMDQIIQSALKKNISYLKNESIGIPGSYLDEVEFNADNDIINKGSFIQTLVSNPNHIGCHTLDEFPSEPQFAGTQELEKEFIRICAEEIFRGEKNSHDGYVASGGTEANKTR